eukprot:scaffold75401_cov33-Tisochrysis_lutea.AAC.4
MAAFKGAEPSQPPPTEQPREGTVPFLNGVTRGKSRRCRQRHAGVDGEEDANIVQRAKRHKLHAGARKQKLTAAGTPASSENSAGRGKGKSDEQRMPNNTCVAAAVSSLRWSKVRHYCDWAALPIVVAAIDLLSSQR